jgi:hypothetical protein
MNETSEHSGGEVVLYQSPDGEVCLEVRLERESIWLTQRQMAELFDTSTDNVGLHLKNVFTEGELAEEATTEDSSVVQVEGGRRVRRSVKHYSLDAVISVGYRVNSARGTQFRIWATRTLREHLLRGYTRSTSAACAKRASARSSRRGRHSVDNSVAATAYGACAVPSEHSLPVHGSSARSPGSADHPLHRGLGVDLDEVDLGVVVWEDPEDLVGERLADRIHAREVQHDRAEPVYTGEHALRL